MQKLKFNMSGKKTNRMSQLLSNNDSSTAPQEKPIDSNVLKYFDDNDDKEDSDVLDAMAGLSSSSNSSFAKEKD